MSRRQSGIPLLLTNLSARHQELRAMLAEIALKGSRSRLSSRHVRDLCIRFAQLGPTVTVSDFVRSSPSLYAAIPGLAYFDDDRVLAVLQVLLRHENAYARAALRVLYDRYRRFPGERERITAMVRQQYTKGSRDFMVWYQSRRLAKRMRVASAAPGRLVLGRSFIQAALLALASSIAWLAALPALLQDKPEPGVAGTIAIVLMIPALLLVWSDSKKLPGHRIAGHRGLDSWPTWAYGCLCLYFPYLFIPVYLLSRERIQGNISPHLGEQVEAVLAK